MEATNRIRSRSIEVAAVACLVLFPFHAYDFVVHHCIYMPDLPPLCGDGIEIFFAVSCIPFLVFPVLALKNRLKGKTQK